MILLEDIVNLFSYVRTRVPTLPLTTQWLSGTNQPKIEGSGEIIEIPPLYSSQRLLFSMHTTNVA